MTLHCREMDTAVAFYQSLGLEMLYGGPQAVFTSFKIGPGFLNLQLAPAKMPQPLWGRVIFYVDDVDAMFQRVLETGRQPDAEPADAPWGERYFHVHDPDGHELSFARPL